MSLMNVLLDVGLGLVIGLSLGLLGGGGSILAVPALVYLVGQSPQVAITTSLMIVGTNSAIGAYFHRSHGALNWRVAGIFGGVGMLTAYVGAALSQHIAPHLLMLAFASLMLFIGLLMIFRGAPVSSVPLQTYWPIVILSGAVVGLLTGFLGVGGGFLIVPALVLLVGLPMSQAVGTSLLVIAMNSFAGFLGHLAGLTVDMWVVVILAISGVLGAWVGTKLTKQVSANVLQRLFAVLVIGLGLFLWIDNVASFL